MMARRRILSLSLKNKDLQDGKSVSTFHYYSRTIFTNRLFLCLLLRNINYLTLNHKQQCLFHLKTVA